jgi:hypothetical protein
VDVAYRWNRSAVSHDDAQVGTMAPGLLNVHP